MFCCCCCCCFLGGWGRYYQSLYNSRLLWLTTIIALGWPCHRDGRHTHAKSSLLQQALRRNAQLQRSAQSQCSEKVSQRPAEETASTGRNQPSATAPGGLRSRQLVLISEKSQLQVQLQGREAQSHKGEMQEAESVSSLPTIFSLNLRLSNVQ